MEHLQNWDDVFKEEPFLTYLNEINDFLDKVYKLDNVYPLRKDIFRAFELTPPAKVKCVIIGQDPYHQPGQAHGLAFSVKSGVPLPPSLKNIYREIENDLGIKMRNDGDLTYLANQGVLLLNVHLTVFKDKPLSHSIDVYEKFTKSILKVLNDLEQPIAFILWGKKAQKFEKTLQNPRHLVIKSNHPSPLSANRGGFFNTKPFSKTNIFLIKNKQSSIDWQN
ncbi:MAG: uracil-DNA glycosylase [Erysipelotrichaceae bacterium]|jgi:uracil-DNA glycosylase|nr:uracil-DNA glycosylase [Bacillota bacterium]MDY0118027.1 uracil-DNA glycosylase [Bacilli bacterium]NLJ32325.1 uracil-DNA glycosylase [Erysipelotrichaceae bacterium]